jgi:hypothetical protein
MLLRAKTPVRAYVPETPVRSYVPIFIKLVALLFHRD